MGKYINSDLKNQKLKTKNLKLEIFFRLCLLLFETLLEFVFDFLDFRKQLVCFGWLHLVFQVFFQLGAFKTEFGLKKSDLQFQV